MKLEQAKEWLRVDGDANDQIIGDLLLGTEQYIEQATGIRTQDQELNPLAETCQKMLLSLWYNPDQDGADKIQRTIDNLLKSLSYKSLTYTKL